MSTVPWERWAGSSLVKTDAVVARVRVRFAETDQMGVVYHSNYLIWMEVGRVELCRALGIRYRDMEREGVLLTVAEASCRYHAPARPMLKSPLRSQLRHCQTS